jgi:hypothetical protein
MKTFLSHLPYNKRLSLFVLLKLLSSIHRTIGISNPKTSQGKSDWKHYIFGLLSKAVGLGQL